MKKTLKAIIAFLIIAMIAAAMIPSVTAADPAKTLTIKSESKEFTFTVYKVASLNTDNGKYTVCGEVDAAIVAAINTAGQSGATFLKAFEGKDKVGEKKADITGKEGETSFTITEGDANTGVGIYYVRNNEGQVNDSVFVWPEFKGGKWDYSLTEFDLGTKLSTPKVTKFFSEDTTESLDSKTAGQNDIINFTLKSEIVGKNTEKEKLEAYQVWDEMCPGLAYVPGSIKIYYDSVADANAADDDFESYTVNGKTEKADISVISTNDAFYGSGTKFEFNAKADALAVNAASRFYSAKFVVITYSAKVLNTAGIGNKYNPNQDGMIYTYPGKKPVPVKGREVKVYTFSAEATKIDGSATAKAMADDPNAKPVPLGGAEIGLYSDEACTKLIASGISADGTGKVEFKAEGDSNTIRLGEGKYYVKEIKAPEGFALSTVVYLIQVDGADTTHGMTGDGIFNLTGNGVIENFIPKIPETGGAGTWMFTLIGAALILCAGALFVVVLKKKTTK